MSIRDTISFGVHDLELDKDMAAMAARLTRERGRRVTKGEILVEAFREYEAAHPPAPDPGAVV